MTQLYTPPWVIYSANGIETLYTFPWKIGLAADLVVYVLTPGSAMATLVSNYTVAGVGASSGSITFATAPPDGSVVFLGRRTAQTQLIDYLNNDPFGAEAHEAALDKLTRMIQDLEERLSRIPHLPQTTLNALRSLTLPPPGAGKVFGWSGSGSEIVLYDTVPPGTIVQPHLLLTDFGAVGDGVTDDSAALQAACNAAVAAQMPLRIPAAAGGYRIDTPINLTNLEAPLLLVGDGHVAPAFGAALVPPSGGSLLLGNTGTGNAMFECLGSNNLLFRDLTLSSLGQPSPSHVGIVFGTSTTSPALQAPGGANCSLENVAIWLTYNINSVPLYFVGGAGLCHYTNLWTLGDFGVVMTANDVLNYTPSYVTVGPAIGVDGMHFAGCNFLGYGTQAVVYIEGSHNMRFDQLYVVTIFGGPAYSGQPYAIFINEATDIKMDVECDYFPSVLLTQGSLRNVHIQGSTFPNLTPLPSDAPIVAAFLGTSVLNSSFRVEGVMAPVSNYWFTSHGTVPTMTLYLNTDFVFDQTVSTNVFFGHATNDFGIPFFNLRFNGNADASVVISMQIDGVPTVDAEKRYFLNGNKLGAA